MTEVLARLVLVVGGSTELSIVAKASAILVLGLVTVRLCRRAPASVRSLVLAATFGILLILPISALVMPPVAVEVGAAAVTLETPGFSAPTGTIRGEYAVVPSSDRSANLGTNTRPLPVRRLLAVVWAAGATVFLIPVVGTVWRLRHMRRRALRWRNGETLGRSLSREIGLNRQVEFLVLEGVAVPFTYGSVRPAIVMPSDVEHWTDAESCSALIHELEHVRRADWPMHLLARVVCALYWFHPLVWSAWRRFCLESELACDNAVVRASTEQIAYAEQLVSLARRLSSCAPAAVLSMANRGDLTARVAAVLDTTPARGRVGMVWAA